MKRLHRDGAGEFFDTDKLMKPVLVKHNILGATSTYAAGIHQQNSVAEQNNRTLQDGIRTRLIQANLSLSFWWFEAEDMIDIDNIIPYRDSPPRPRTRVSMASSQRSPTSGVQATSSPNSHPRAELPSPSFSSTRPSAALAMTFPTSPSSRTSSISRRDRTASRSLHHRRVRASRCR